MPLASEDEFLPTRRSLLSRLKNWDDNAGWWDFFETYGRFIFSAAMKCGLRREEAEDVVQEVVISVAKKMPGFVYDPVGGSFKAWLMCVTHSRATDFLRKKCRRIPSVAGDYDEGLNAAETPAELEELWDEEWRHGLLEAAVARVKAKVKPRQFQVFDLSVNQGLAVGAVAKALGLSHLNVRVTKHRVAKLLAEEIRRVETAVNG